MLKCSPTPPPPPQCPPPSSINKNEDDEDQYCAPWDLKLQEEMFKKMSQGKKNETGTVQNSPKSEDNMISEKANAATASDLNNSIKSNNSTSDLSSSKIYLFKTLYLTAKWAGILRISILIFSVW